MNASVLFGIVDEDIGFNAVSKAFEFFADAAQVREPLHGKVKVAECLTLSGAPWQNLALLAGDGP